MKRSTLRWGSHETQGSLPKKSNANQKKKKKFGSCLACGGGGQEEDQGGEEWGAITVPSIGSESKKKQRGKKKEIRRKKGGKSQDWPEKDDKRKIDQKQGTRGGKCGGVRGFPNGEAKVGVKRKKGATQRGRERGNSGRCPTNWTGRVS